MKKQYIIGISLIVIILIGTVLYFSFKPKENYLNNLNATELEEKINNKESFILVFTQDGCAHCEEYKPVLERVLNEYKIKAYEINLTELRKNEEENKKVAKYFNIQGTPTTVFVNDGEEKTTMNRLVGSSKYSNLVEKFKERGFIKE